MIFSDNSAFLQGSSIVQSSDWEKLSIQDIKRTHDEATIARYLPIVLHSYPECELNSDSKLAKLFVMAQTCVQYLHNRLLQVSQNENWSQAKKAVENQSLTKYPVYQCLYCAKAFISSHFLHNHVRRRHERFAKLQANNQDLPAPSPNYEARIPSPAFEAKSSVTKCETCSTILPSDIKTADTQQTVQQEKVLPQSGDQENRSHLIEARLLQETKKMIEEHLKKAIVTQGVPPLCSLPSESCARPHDSVPVSDEKEVQIQVPLKRTSQLDSESGNEALRTKSPNIACGPTIDLRGKQPEPVLMQSERFETGFSDNALSSLIMSEVVQHSPNKSFTAAERTTKKKKGPNAKVHKILEIDASPAIKNKAEGTNSHGGRRVRSYINRTLENRLQTVNISPKSFRISSLDMSGILTSLRSTREKAWKGNPHYANLRENIAEKLNKLALASLAQSSAIETKSENTTVRYGKFLFNAKKNEQLRVGDNERRVRSQANVNKPTNSKRKGTEMDEAFGNTSWNSDIEYEVLRRTPTSLSRNGEI